MLTRCWRTC